MQGLMVTINSDDPPMFGSNLLEEYLLAYERFGFTLGAVAGTGGECGGSEFLCFLSGSWRC